MMDQRAGSSSILRRAAASARLALLVMGVAALAAGCGRDGEAGAPGSPGGAGGPGGRGGPGGAVAVAVVPVEVGAIARSLEVSGVIEPIRTVGINSQMSGSLLSIHAEEGAKVSRGQVMARLDDRELRAQVAAAEAEFQVAESAYRRAEQLRERNVITLPEFERDRTAFTAAQAELDQLRTRLEFATIEAPIDGIVTEKRVEAGDVVAPQTRLFTVSDVSTMVVRVQVSELDVVELKPGDEVGVALDAFPGRQLSGRIRRVFPAADPATRLVPVEVALEREAAALARPGFLARASFALGQKQDVLLVPAAALVGGGRGQAVYVVEEGRAVRRTVTTGLTSQGRVEVITGLRDGDQVVTLGNNTLQDGTPVRVIAARGDEPDGGGDEPGATGQGDGGEGGASPAGRAGAAAAGG